MTGDSAEFRGERLTRMTVAPGLEDGANRARWGLGRTPDERGPYLIELNVLHADGLTGAATEFSALFGEVFGDATEPWRLVAIGKTYFRCDLSLPEWMRLITADETAAAERAAREGVNDQARYRTVYKLWPDFPVQAQITRSVATIKADAALRSFDATGDGITWAVIDTGIDRAHPHFNTAGGHVLDHPDVRNLHRCFAPVGGQPLPDPQEISGPEKERRLDLHRQHALADGAGHGTHVAGIISGRAPGDVDVVIFEKEERVTPGDENSSLPQRQTIAQERTVAPGREREGVHGVAPGCKLVSLRTFDDAGSGRSSDIVRALEYIREELNDNPKLFRVHGVNISVGYEFDATMFACGQSPLCTAVNRLVQSGVVVVAAAGNTGYTELTAIAANDRPTKVGLSNTINDPGNAEYAITVGSTHRDAPHTYGISYFSSKGPTGDGRLKPDLVAPGERIISCAAGSKRDKTLQLMDQPVQPLDDKRAGYVQDSGTSMAAPHVSGAIAAFLSIRREFIGQPLRVKQIFLDSAVPLGRERYFEGHGLVDLMKAIQSV